MTIPNHNRRIPKLTKMAFEYIADILCEIEADVDTVELFAEQLSDTNPRFKQQVFIDRALGWMDDDDELLWEDDDTPTEAVIVPFPDRGVVVMDEITTMDEATMDKLGINDPDSPNYIPRIDGGNQ
jgi:hypothetical protein